MRRNFPTSALLALIPTAVGCSDGDTPALGFTTVTDAKDAGATHDVGAPTPEPPGSSVPPPPSPAEAGADVHSEPGEPLPEVWLAGPDDELPCDNVRVGYDFDPSVRAYTHRNAFWMMWFAMRAFVSDQNSTREEMLPLGFTTYTHLDAADGLQALVAGSERLVVVSFRGSTEIDDYLSNSKFALMDGKELDVAGHLHTGFGNAVRKSWKELYEVIDATADRGQPIWLSGHSLGGAMAVVVGSKLVDEGHDVAAVYTFASPRVGDSEFAQYVLNRLDRRSYRVVNHLDLTPRVPPAGVAAEQAAKILNFNPLESWAEDLIRDLDYAHAGGMYLFNERDELEYWGVSGDEEDKVYWDDRAEHVSSIPGLIADNTENFYRHEQATYLCKMLAVRNATTPSQ